MLFLNFHLKDQSCNSWSRIIYWDVHCSQDIRHMRSVQKVSIHVVWKEETLLKKIQNIRNTVHRTMMPQSPLKYALRDLTQFSQSPSAVPLYFPESHWRTEIASLLKVILVLGKARSLREPNLGCRGLSHLCYLMFLKNTLHELWCMSGLIVMMKLPITRCP